MKSNTNETGLLTYHNKPIEIGQKYFLILHDFRVVELVGGKEESNKKSLTRFLTKSGVDKFLIKEKKKLETEIKEEIVPVKTEAELLEEKITKLEYPEQLDYVNSKEDFSQWLKRNKIVITYPNSTADSKGQFTLIKDAATIVFNCSWCINTLRGCCGAREQMSHNGSIHPEFIKNTNNERSIKLLQYLAPHMQAIMLLQNAKFGIVSYVKNPGNFSDPSGRIGIMLSFLDTFTKTGSFINPNTSNMLDIYAINDNWLKISNE